jgi:hypothetical protein
MDGWLPILFLAVVLKIPVFAGLYLVWYAVRAEPETEDAPGDSDHGFHRWRREPTGPRGPRRGPHGGAEHALPDCPPGGRNTRSRPRAAAEHQSRRLAAAPK